MSSFNRIYVSENLDNKLRLLKARTGLRPNLIIRLGFVLSLEEDGIPDGSLYGEEQAREFNRFTLTGAYDLHFMALLKERLVEDRLDPDRDLEAQFKAHIARGVHLLAQRIRSLEDIGHLIENAQKKAQLRAVE